MGHTDAKLRNRESVNFPLNSSHCPVSYRHSIAQTLHNHSRYGRNGVGVSRWRDLRGSSLGGTFLKVVVPGTQRHCSALTATAAIVLSV